eukprot:scaffold7122_cov102-Isochrysis_galbana.AAC.1
MPARETACTRPRSRRQTRARGGPPRSRAGAIALQGPPVSASGSAARRPHRVPRLRGISAEPEQHSAGTAAADVPCGAPARLCAAAASRGTRCGSGMPRSHRSGQGCAERPD